MTQEKTSGREGGFEIASTLKTSAIWTIIINKKGYKPIRGINRKIAFNVKIIR